jgi:hypothetical protein
MPKGRLAALIAPKAKIEPGAVVWTPVARLVRLTVGLAAMKAIRPGLVDGTM